MKPREHPQYDPLFKISPLLNRLRSAMQSIELKEMHAIDEQMIPFKGRSSMKQYMKKSLISGVSKCLHKQILQAPYVTLKFTPESLRTYLEFGISGNVVMRLIQNLNAASNFKVFLTIGSLQLVWLNV